jgi:hypothetical protein
MLMRYAISLSLRGIIQINGLLLVPILFPISLLHNFWPLSVHTLHLFPRNIEACDGQLQ